MRYFGKITDDKDVTTKEFVRDFIEKGQYDNGTITIAKLAANAKYWDEVPRKVDEGGALITQDWGHIFNWSWGSNQAYTFTLDFFNNNPDTFWETIIYAQDKTTIAFPNVPIIDMNKGSAIVTKADNVITIPYHRYMHIKRIGTTALVLSGSYNQTVTYSGTSAPNNSLGENGDVYIQYT